MLRSIVQLALRHRVLVTLLAMLWLGYGVEVTRRARLDVFPDFVPPQVSVQTECPGLSAEQVEMLVTTPVESLLNGIVGLEAIRSESLQGLSVINLVFADGTKLWTLRQTVAERLNELAGKLPQGVSTPKMSPPVSATMDLLKIGITSEKLTPMELRTFADWTMRPRLLGVPGVAKVSLFGGDVKEWQVQPRMDALVAHGVSLNEVQDAARQACGVRGAGFIEGANQRLVLRSDAGLVTAETLGAVMVARGEHGPVLLRDVADVRAAAAPKFGDALIMGKPGVLLAMAGQYGANTLEVTLAVEQAIETLRPACEAAGIELHLSLHRPATFIENALHHMRGSLVWGAVFVAAVLLIFLLDVRTALISFVSIPLSLVTAVVVLDWFGVALDTMTLGGFAVALGVVADDAIIDVENILRRLRANASSSTPRSRIDVVLDASLEVRGAVVYATFIVALVFVPVLMMKGLQGKFFGPLGCAFLLATFASLAVALVITPALCLLLLPDEKSHREPLPILWLKAMLGGVLRLGRALPLVAVGVPLVLVAVAVLLGSRFGGELLPTFREGHFVVQATMASGTSMPEMLRTGERLTKLMLSDERVATVEQQVGRAERGEDTWGPNKSEFHVELKRGLSGDDEEECQEHLREMLKSYLGITSEVLTFLGDRIGESIGGETSSVVVSVFGDDLDVLDAKARAIAQVLHEIPGAADVQVKAPPGSPEIVIRIKPDAAARAGFRPAELLEIIETCTAGNIVGQSYEGARVFDVDVILPMSARRSPEQLGQLMLTSATGERRRLDQVADIFLSSGRPSIFHDGARRRQVVTCNAEGRDLESFVEEAKQAISKKVSMPSGTYVEFSGEAEAAEHATHDLWMHSAAAAVAIVMLLALIFSSPRQWLLVLLNAPFAMIGGVFAVSLLAHGEASLGTLVGFVTLFGLSTRNAILFVSHLQHLIEHEGRAWSFDTVCDAAKERLVPILMTALVTALALAPIAFGGGKAGEEIEAPMALVICGGLASSTLLTLTVLPLLAWWTRARRS